MKRFMRGRTLIILTFTAAAALLESAVWAEDFHFVAGEPGGGEAIWEPSVVLIDQDEDLKGGITFTLHNPTKVEHAFAVRGLYELVTEKGTLKVDPAAGETHVMDFTLRPINVKIQPGEKKQIHVNTRELHGGHAVGSHFRFFCPIHKDVHIGGSIYVVG